MTNLSPRSRQAFCGLGSRARSLAAHRQHGIHGEPQAEWEAEAIDLELDIYAGMYGCGKTYEQLAHRAEWVKHAHASSEEGKPPPPRDVMIDGTTVTNTLRVLEDIADNVISTNVKMRHLWPDRVAGTGAWPELA